MEIEYMRTAEVFSRLPTKSLPYIFHVPPHFSLEGDGILKVLPRDVMQVGLSMHNYGHASAVVAYRNCRRHGLPRHSAGERLPGIPLDSTRHRGLGGRGRRRQGGQDRPAVLRDALDIPLCGVSLCTCALAGCHGMAESRL